eukprot:TRINITY_DN73202_c0_g1_i1.p1 TRINITY_DN73202_c0_g1~~TRINITY_DN73202_c0_g1_i1.p1  ORF type:complete len:503 (+),score=52.86 TRINITY_DN73202_c0_g1_i1:161-1669(+)
MATHKEATKLVQVGSLEFMVDGFQFQRRQLQHYVLTHFHSDHTVGLNQKFSSGTIYCTPETAALVMELICVDSERVKSLPLHEPSRIGDVLLTFLDADHCPGSAAVMFEDLNTGQLVLHSGDCRASEKMQRGVLDTLGRRRLHKLFLDTTYFKERWSFPAQGVVCSWISELVRAEHLRQPRTLFVIGSYQIGKERAVQAVAEALDSPVYIEARRWSVVQLAGWGGMLLTSGKPLWATKKDGCRVWMTSMGSLGHDALKRILDTSNGEFEAVVGLRPTGWCWSPRAMSPGSSGCRVWAKNDDCTRIYSVPYSEHSSYTELCALVKVLRPEMLIPTVNAETSIKRQQLIDKFEHVLGLSFENGRAKGYAHWHAAGHVVSLGSEDTCSGSGSSNECMKQSRRKRPRWAAGLLGNLTVTSSTKSTVFADLSNLGKDALLARRTNRRLAHASGMRSVIAENYEECRARVLRPFVDVKLRPTVGCRAIDLSESSSEDDTQHAHINRTF